MDRQISAFWEVLAQKTVRVFVQSALLGAFWIKSKYR